MINQGLLLSLLFSLAACTSSGSTYSQKGNVAKHSYTHVSGVTKRRSATEDAIHLIATSTAYAAGHVAVGGALTPIDTAAAVQSVSSIANNTAEKAPDKVGEKP